MVSTTLPLASSWLVFPVLLNHWFHLKHSIISFSHKILRHLINLLFSMFSTCFIKYFPKELFIKNHFCDPYYITTHRKSKKNQNWIFFFININHFWKGQNWLLNILLIKVFPKFLAWLPNMLKVICDPSMQKYLIGCIQNIGENIQKPLQHILNSTIFVKKIVS